ncbi:MAG: serine/threonine-protein kinase, partial [Anaerohalosphaeraceae bacterium]
MADTEKDKKPPKDGFPTASQPGSSAVIEDHIEPFTLLSVLGEGGFGIVYLAEQKHPIKRQVALKILKPGMDSRRIVARFEAERQALALLDHPNIAHVLEAGSAESGRPYFVMEYIKGLPITEYCDYHQLNIAERLRLYIQVCEAIGHAHQKGIIHRDIKPSNILVNDQDETALPKIIDFGVAKAIGMPLTDKTLITQQGQLLGTPEYMSPEQADFKERDIDTRTDIYSLGVVLYELVAGVLPFESCTLREAGYTEIQRIIREQEPPRPSSRLSHLGQDAARVAQNRHTELSTLVRNLHQELEWIPMKAIRKDRKLRYQTASELAQDIRNYLEGDPLIAGPESASYRIQKFVQKYKVPVMAVVTIAVLIVISLLTITALYIRSEKLKRETIMAKVDAEKARDEIERQMYNHSMALADASKVYNVKYAR